MKQPTSLEWQAGYREGFMAAQRRAIAYLVMQGQMMAAPKILSMKPDPPTEFEPPEEMTMAAPAADRKP